MCHLDIVVTDSMVSPIDAKPFHYAVFASDLGLRPGEWPRTLKTSLGNGQPFIGQTKHVNRENEIEWADYLQGNGCVSLRVYND